MSLAILLWLSPSLGLARAFAVAPSQDAKPDAGKPASVAPDTRTLEVGKPVEREMKGGETHAYEIALEAGQYLNVVVDQRGIDVKVTVAGPDGKQLLEFNSRKQGQETVAVVAESSGGYRLNVQPVDKRLRLVVTSFAWQIGACQQSEIACCKRHPGCTQRPVN
jgi:hypothetical protein